MFRLKDWPPGVRYTAFWDICSLTFQIGDLLEYPIAPPQLADNLFLEVHQNLHPVHESAHGLYETRPTWDLKCSQILQSRTAWMSAYPSVSQLSVAKGIATWHSIEKNDNFSQCGLYKIAAAIAECGFTYGKSQSTCKYLCLWIY